MSGNPVKNYGKKPRRNLPCNEIRKHRQKEEPEEISFFLDLTSAYNTAQ